MGKKIKIGLIGAGNIAQNAHIPAYLQNEDVELIAVCDLNLQRAQEVKEKYNMKYAVGSIAELVAIEEIDAVSVCTWNNAHAEASIAAANAGKHVLCEKPMAMTVAQANDMAAAAKANNITFQMGFTNRYRDEAAIVIDLLENDAFGQIYYAKTGELRRRGTPLGWFTDKDKSGGGPIIDIGVHSIYTTWYMMGKPNPIAISAQIHSEIGDYKTKNVSRWTAFDQDDLKYTVEDSGEGLIRFDNGATMFFENSWAINGEGDSTAKIYGTKGGATISPEFKIYQEQNGYLLDSTPYTDIKTDIFSNEINEFISCIQEGRTPLTSADDGVTIQRILNGIYESAAKGCEVKI